MMPKLNGFDVLKNLREKSGLPVLMLTARGDDMERIVGLRSVPTIICRNRSIRASWSRGLRRSFVERLPNQAIICR
jgi:CheY-like chemotaxis protein